MRRAATIGMFDGVHLGHQALVSQLCAIAGERGLQPVAYTFDRHPMQLVAPERAPLLLTSAAERCRLLVEAGADEACALRFDQAMRTLTAEEFMLMMQETHRVDALLVGFNHRFGRDRVGDFETYRAIGHRVGIDVQLCDRVVEVDGTVVSSSAIRQALLSGDVATARAMLGRPYAVTGTVAHGRSIGHTIGFPTANVVPSVDLQIIPAQGVYAAYAQTSDAQSIPAMVNIGRRPTIEGRDDAPLSIEAHLIGIDTDLYGRQLTLSFVHRLRAEQRFASLEALAAQLALDRQAVIDQLQIPQ